MGDIKNHPPCVLVVAAFSRDDCALSWLWEQVRSHWGEILMLSEPFDFAESEYYRKTMGEGLKKQFCAMSAWYDPSELAADKRRSNQWEIDYATLPSSEGTTEANIPERPLNIDPGYMSMTKIVLASTKNREHRIYLRDGIYAEVTLAYRDQAWQPMAWTYPDYQRADVRAFFHQARGLFAKRVAAKHAQDESMRKRASSQ